MKDEPVTPEALVPEKQPIPAPRDTAPIFDFENLSLVPSPISKEQLGWLLRKRNAGDSIYDHVIKTLNHVFGFMWDFTIEEYAFDEVNGWKVKGRLVISDHRMAQPLICRMGVGKAYGPGDVSFEMATMQSLIECAGLLGIDVE